MARTPKPSSGSLRPWPFLGAAVVFITAGTGLISDDGRTAAGEALIILGIVLVSSWIVLMAAQSPMDAVRGWRDADPDPPDDDEQSG